MKKLWLLFAAVLALSFSVLGWVGTRIYQEVPPLQVQVVTTDGKVLIPTGDIEKGQNVWQAMGGMQQGSIWGHGGYLAPDWSADWLHREALAHLDIIAQKEESAPFAQLDERRREYARVALRLDMRRNTYDPQTGAITVSNDRARAIAAGAIVATSVVTALACYAAFASFPIESRFFEMLIGGMTGWLLGWCAVAVVINRSLRPTRSPASNYWSARKS